MAMAESFEGGLPDSTPRNLATSLVDLGTRSLGELRHAEGHFTQAQIAVSAYVINRMFNSALGNAAIVDKSQPTTIDEETGIELPAFVSRTFFAEYPPLAEGEYEVIFGSRHIADYPMSEDEAHDLSRPLGHYDDGEASEMVYLHLTGVAQEAMDVYAKAYADATQDELAQAGREAVWRAMDRHFKLLRIHTAMLEQEGAMHGIRGYAGSTELDQALQDAGVQSTHEAMEELRQDPLYMAYAATYEAWRNAGAPGSTLGGYLEDLPYVA